MAHERQTIRSIEALRERVPEILKRLNADPALLLAAAANPILALEELGYTVPDEFRSELDRRIRYTSDERKRLEALRAQIFEAAAHSFDIDDAAALQEILFARLQLPPLPPEPVRVSLAPSAETRSGDNRLTQLTSDSHPLSVRYRAAGLPTQPDTLEPLRDHHPVIGPLIAYRSIVARHAPFAPREIYERVRLGDVRGPAFKLRARLHRTRRA
jgi:hypothetical protein